MSSTPKKYADASEIAMDTDYDVPGWLHDTFGLDPARHYIGVDFQIRLRHDDPARVHFDVFVTHAELEDLFARRRKAGT